MKIKRFNESNCNHQTKILGFDEFNSVSEGITNQVDYYVEKFQDAMPVTTEQGAAHWVDSIGGLSVSEKKAIFFGIKHLVTKEGSTDMPAWINESLLNEDDGFGEQHFVRIKKGDSYIYLFKLELENDHKGIALQIGKYSPSIVIPDAKNSYGVMSTSELTEDEVEQGVVDPERFEIPKNNINVTDDSTERLVRMLVICMNDYVTALQPKTVRIYDETPSTCTDPNYSQVFDRLGASFGWDVQEMEAGKLNVLTKVSITV